MPELVIPVGFAQCALRWRMAGDPEEMISTIGVELDGTAETPEEVALAVGTLWLAAWAPASFSNQATFVGVTAYVGNDGPNPTPGESLFNTAGGSASAMLPQNCCVLVRKTTGLGGRRNRGRMYLPALHLAEGSVDNIGAIAGATVASMQSQMNNFRSGLLGSGAVGQPVLFHSAAPITPTVITSFSVQSLIATQRERLRR